MTDIKVVSFRRSGTHYLMALLWENFSLGETSGTEPVRDRKWAGEVDNGRASIPWKRLFGGHWAHSVHKQKAPWPEELNLYIVRHPYCCLRSLWLLYGAGESFEAFCRDDRLEAWCEHVVSWLDTKAVTYEQLCASPIQTLTWIQQQYNLKRREDGPFKLVNKSVGWNPGDRAFYNPATANPVIRERMKQIFNVVPQIRKRFGYTL